VCHHFYESKVRACLSPGLAERMRSRDWKPDEREYWRPGHRWREPDRFAPQTAVDLIRESLAEEARQRLFNTR
jgi:hypothetical protein